MNSSELNYILSRSCETFIGVYARDELPTNVNGPICLVANLDKSHQSGSHWICIAINDKGEGLYCDSFGIPPMYSEFITFMDQNTIFWEYNDKSLQCFNSSTCGHYCIYVLFNLQNKSIHKILLIFSNDCSQNDFLVYRFCKRLYLAVSKLLRVV